MGFFDDIISFQSQNVPISIPGVVTGVVKENWDKDNPGKVKVEILLGETGKNLTSWIPVITPYGGNEHGLYALPEIGSEVVIAFIMGDRNCPIVIGSLWNNQNKLPANTAVEKNTIKRLRTKGGHEVVFDDEDKKTKFEINTPGKFSIVIDDEKKNVTIKDENNKNAISLDAEKGELELTAEKKISFKLGSETMLTLDGSGKKATLNADSIDISAKQALDLKGQNATLAGSGNTVVQAQSKLELKASGAAELKGSMVKIN